MLGRYRPLRPLGSGGSGSVWLVRDEQTGLDVALKIVPREGKAAARAEREAQAAAQLRHPSCLRAYAFARDPRHVYIAYEFVPGRTFREALRAGELDDRAAIEACAQICDGLAHAHRAGILHRDVKPSNVLLADGGGVSVRILDFGLARMAEAETLTAQGDVPGTLAYIAPERLAGDDATGAADVWAVGVMLWEALSGRHPFWQSSMLETARAIEAGRAVALGAPSGPPERAAPARRPLALARACDPAVGAGARRPAPRQRCSAARQARRAAAARFAVPAEAGRAGAAVLAAGFAGWTAGTLPFFPHGWAFGLAAVAAAATGVPRAPRPRSRARRADPPARQHLARPRARLRRGRGGLARALVARAAQRPALRRRCRCSRRSPRSDSCRSSSRASARLPAALRRRPSPCSSQRSRPGFEASPCR